MLLKSFLLCLLLFNDMRSCPLENSSKKPPLFLCHKRDKRCLNEVKANKRCLIFSTMPLLNELELVNRTVLL